MWLKFFVLVNQRGLKINILFKFNVFLFSEYQQKSIKNQENDRTPKLKHSLPLKYYNDIVHTLIANF